MVRMDERKVRRRQRRLFSLFSLFPRDKSQSKTGRRCAAGAQIGGSGFEGIGQTGASSGVLPAATSPRGNFVETALLIQALSLTAIISCIVGIARETDKAIAARGMWSNMSSLLTQFRRLGSAGFLEK